MPGKVNPVIPEYVIQLSLSVTSFDNIITHASSQGNFELNHLTPAIIHYTLKSIDFLKKASYSLMNYIKLIEADINKCEENLLKSFTIITPLIDILGYTEVSQELKKNNYDLEKTLLSLSEKHNLNYKEMIKKIKSNKSAGLGYIIK
nr:hypothetical protein [Marinitoga lauensis]